MDDSNQILHNDEDHQILFVAGPNARNKSKMADGCHLEKLKNFRISANV